MSFRLMFWNCSVAPPQGNGKSNARDAAGVIASAFADGIELVALCEVDKKSMRDIRTRLGNGGPRFITLADPIGRSRWDFGVFYSSTLSCRTSKAAVSPPPRPVRGGHGVDVQRRDGSLAFRLYLVHWASRRDPSGSSKRRRASIVLRNRVDHDLDRGLRIVVMGDFNDEPFDGPLSLLQASRDPRRVLLAPDRWLYNPSWSLAAPTGHDPWAAFGSHEYRRGETSTHYLYDQALTSSHFLSERIGAAPSVRLVGGPQGRPANSDHTPLELTLP